MSDAILAVGMLLLAAGSLFAAYQGWKAIIRNPRLRGQPRADLAKIAKSPRRLILFLMFVAVVVGLIAGIVLSERVDEGRERRFEERRGER